MAADQRPRPALTAAQQRALDVLSGMDGWTTPRDFAAALYPDSDAWSRRTRGQRGGNRSGAVGGTMPMLGARMLWRLHELGWASFDDHGRWRARPAAAVTISTPEGDAHTGKGSTTKHSTRD